ncbi:MAG: YsnF/AvaK domain-containing protein [Solirubrobacterales bacterium]
MHRENTPCGDAKMLVKREVLDVGKNRVQTGEVTLTKNVVEENQTVIVPVAREEVVIERRALHNQPSDTPIEDCVETIRIPVSEEVLEVGKHTVVTGEVSAYKREVEEVHQISDEMKREEVQIDREGHTHVTEQDYLS